LRYFSTYLFYVKLPQKFKWAVWDTWNVLNLTQIFQLCTWIFPIHKCRRIRIRRWSYHFLFFPTKIPHASCFSFSLLLRFRREKLASHRHRNMLRALGCHYSGRFYEIPSARKSVGKGHYLTYNPDPIMYVVFTSLRLIIVSTTGVQRPFVAANRTIYSSF